MIEPFGVRWPREFLQSLKAKRKQCADSLALLRTRDSEYCMAHVKMLHMYDAAIAAAVEAAAVVDTP